MVLHKHDLRSKGVWFWGEVIGSWLWGGEGRACHDIGVRTPSLGIRGWGRLVSGIQRLLEAGQVAGVVMGVGEQNHGGGLSTFIVGKVSTGSVGQFVHLCLPPPSVQFPTNSPRWLSFMVLCQMAYSPTFLVLQRLSEIQAKHSYLKFTLRSLINRNDSITHRSHSQRMCYMQTYGSSRLAPSPLGT